MFQSIHAISLTGTESSGSARVCLFSLRHLERHVSRCGDYEFEDTIGEMDDADLLMPEPCVGYSLSQRAANRLARHTRLACFHPWFKVPPPKKDYDVFVMICQQPRDLLALNAVRGWKKHCRTSVCWLVEFWASGCSLWTNHLRLLAQFDHVFLMFNGSVGPVADEIGKPCHFLPPGVDTLTFCPYPDPPLRAIDVFGMGRRSEVTHQALLKLSEQRRIFYVYDTVDPMYTLYPRQHRRLVADMAKRSRYFIVNAPKINKPSEAGGQNEVSYRFIEGAAAGTCLIGDPGPAETYSKVLDWPDAVLHMPYDTADVESLLADWDSQPQRLNRIRKNGIIQSLVRHDWAYRWQAILDTIGLEPRPALPARIRRLHALAEHIEHSPRQRTELGQEDRLMSPAPHD